MERLEILVAPADQMLLEEWVVLVAQ